MDGWPRIPNPGGGSGKSPRTTGTSLPAPGSTVVANVEDELGDGLYSLRWAGQKIHVSSKSPLAKGQALLLKSETSPEGRPRLVVVGSAPEQAAPSGRIIYGPNVGKKPSADQQAHQQAVAQSQARNAGLAQSRIGGNIVDTGSRAGQPGAGAPGQAGGQMAAGVAAAVTARAGDPAPGLIGLVLEPLPDFDDSSKRLLEAAKKEAEQLEKQQAADPEEAEETGEETETAETDSEENTADSADSTEEAKKNRKDLPRPVVTGQAGQTGQGGKQGAGNAAGGAPPGSGQVPPPGTSTAGQAQAQPGQPAASGQTTAPPPRADAVRPAPPVPPVVQDGGPVVPELPDAPPAASGGKTPAPQQPPAAPATSGAPAAPAPQPPVSGTPPQAQPGSPAANAGQPGVSAPGATPLPPPAPSPLPGTPPPPASSSGQPASPAPDNQRPPAPAVPGTPAPQPNTPEQPAVPPGRQPSAPAPGQPAIPPGQPGGQAAPQPLPGTTPAVPAPPPSVPGASQPAGSPPAAAQPNVPAAPLPQPLPAVPGTVPQAPGTPAPPPPPAPGQQPAAPIPPPATPGQPVSPSPVPSGQPPAAPGTGRTGVPVPPGQPGQAGGQSAPQPLPGTVIFEDGGAVVPDVPVDGDSPPPQTRPGTPAASAPPSVPGSSQPAGTPPLPPAPLPAPIPGTPVQQAPAAPGTYPRPGTAAYPRPTPRQSYAHAVADRSTIAGGAHNAAPPGNAADVNGTGDSENAHTDNTAAPANASPPSPQIKPEMLLREALGQMVGAAEIPLGNPAADAARLAPGNTMPEAVLDKAAAILLRGAGLTPDPETMEAAKALVANNVPVDRDGVQALLTAAAGIDDAGEREAALRAAARLLSKDIPLSPPLVSGMADVVSRRATAHQLMDAAMRALAPDASLSMSTGEAEPLMAGARELLDMLHVDLGRADAPAALERALSTFGREALGQALALVETSAQAVLENNPQLQKIDQALTAILSRLQPEMEQTAPQQTPAVPGTPPVSEEAPAAPVPVPAAPPQQAAPSAPQTPQTPPAAVPQANIEELIPPPAAAPVPAEQPVQPQTQAPVPPQPAHPNRPINAYLNAPRALPIEEMLKKLPPMPKVVSLGTPPPAIAPVPPMLIPGTLANVANLANAAAGAQGGAPALPPSTAQQILAQTASQVFPQTQIPSGADAASPGAAPGTLESPPPEPLDPEQIFRQAEALRRQSGVMNKLGSLFQIPGLNRQELELLRPGGFLDSFLSSAADRPDAVRVKAEAEKLLRELMSPDSRTAERALREIPQRDSEVLRETASRLTRMESDAVRADPLMNKLSDAAASLRDLGRQLLAVKAENLALQDRNPGVMLAEVPFKLNDDAGDGRMQMFYRRGKKKGDGWSSRVILDLNTTRMGAVLGDMRFFGQDMTLNMFVDKQDAADYLSVSAEELSENLAAKGFRVKMKFMVLPPPPALDAERPTIAGEDTAEQQEPQSAGVRKTPGRLDIEL